MSQLSTFAKPQPDQITDPPSPLLLCETGFSLIELMVTLVIIGILVIIALPTYSAVKDNTRRAACMAEIRDMEKIIIAYAYDKGSYPDGLDKVNLDTRKDPWGTPYGYSFPPTRRDFALINPDSFDIFSKGPDLQSPVGGNVIDPLSSDDLIRAGDGAFVGTVTSYLGS